MSAILEITDAAEVTDRLSTREALRLSSKPMRRNLTLRVDGYGEITASLRTPPRFDVQIVFAIGLPSEIRFAEKTDGLSAAIWFGRAAFNLDADEEAPVREFLGRHGAKLEAA